MGASESTPAASDSHGHAHADGSIHHGHSHGGASTSSTTTTSRSPLVPAALTAEQLRGAAGVVPHSSQEYALRAGHLPVTIPAGTEQQWQPVPVVPASAAGADLTTAAITAPVATGPGPVVHPDPAADPHLRAHHPTAGPVASSAATATSPAPSAAAAATSGTPTLGSTLKGAAAAPTHAPAHARTAAAPGAVAGSVSQPPPAAVAGAPVVSGGGFAPTATVAAHTLPETGRVQSIKEVEYLPAQPLPTTTPGAPVTVVHTQAATAPPPVHPIEVAAMAAVPAVAATAASTSSSVVNPTLLPPSSKSSLPLTTPTPSSTPAPATAPTRPPTGRSFTTGASNVWERLLTWASPLLPPGSVGEWDSKTVADLVLALPSSEAFRATLQAKQLERKRRRKAQAVEQAEAAAAGKKVPPSPTSATSAAVRGAGGETLPIPYDIASVLLSMDKALSAMRLQWVPSRVSEDTFFVEYFSAIVRALHGQVEDRGGELEGTKKVAAPAPTVLDRVRAIDAGQQPVPQ